jgi:CRISPR system Cascade subunit CasE
MVGSVPRDDDPENDGPGMTEWVAEKLAGAVADVQILNHDRNVIGRKTGRVVQTDLVDGFGVVEDQSKLQELLRGGVGRAKNYGCGLLTVKAIG